LQICTLFQTLSVNTHWRSVVQRSDVDVFSGICFLSVWQCVCPHNNFRTTKRRMIKLGS